MRISLEKLPFSDWKHGRTAALLRDLPYFPFTFRVVFYPWKSDSILHSRKLPPSKILSPKNWTMAFRNGETRTDVRRQRKRKRKKEKREKKKENVKLTHVHRTFHNYDGLALRNACWRVKKIWHVPFRTQRFGRNEHLCNKPSSSYLVRLEARGRGRGTLMPFIFARFPSPGI